jgi:Secretion system C-terminal sorting domain
MCQLRLINALRCFGVFLTISCCFGAISAQTFCDAVKFEANFSPYYEVGMELKASGQVFPNNFDYKIFRNGVDITSNTYSYLYDIEETVSLYYVDGAEYCAVVAIDQVCQRTICQDLESEGDCYFDLIIGPNTTYTTFPLDFFGGYAHLQVYTLGGFGNGYMPPIEWNNGGTTEFNDPIWFGTPPLISVSTTSDCIETDYYYQANCQSTSFSFTQDQSTNPATIKAKFNNPSKAYYQGGSYGVAYTWSTGAVGDSIPFLLGGDTIFVAATDSIGCVDTAYWSTPLTPCGIGSVTLSQTDLPADPGILALSGFESLAGLVFSWDIDTTLTASFYPLAVGQSGTVCVSATNTEGCATGLSCIEIETLDCTISATATQTGTSIKAVGATGDAPYTYLWSDGNTNALRIAYMAGLYTVTVTDQLGCLATATVNFNTCPTETVNIVYVSSSAAGPGYKAITDIISANGITYNWTPSQSSTGNFFPLQLGLPETICVTVTNSDGCLADTCKTIIPPTCTFNPNIVQSGSTLSVSLSGGYAPYTYLWSSGATTNNLVTYASGTYSCTITDFLGCQVVDTFQLNACGTGSASIVLQGTFAGPRFRVNTDMVGFSSGLSYSWTPINTNPTLSYYPIDNSFTEDSVCVTISNIEGCIASDCIEVDTPICSLTAVVTQNNYTITASASLGHPAYDYQWSISALGASINVTQSQIVANSGLFTVTITDFLGCQVIKTHTFVIPCGADLVNITPITLSNNLPGFQAAAQFLTNSGITYTWTPSNPIAGNTYAQTLNMADSLCVIATNTVGCAADTCIDIVQLSCNIEAEIVQYGNLLTASASLGYAPYTYNWSTGTSNPTNQISESQATDSGGLFTVTVTDNLGCSAIVNHTYLPPCGSESVTIEPITMSNNLPGFQANADFWTNAAINYTWTPSNPIISNTYAQTLNMADSLCVIATNTAGCIADTCIEVDPFVCDLEINIVQDELTLTASSSSSYQIFGLQWTYGYTTPSITVTSAGTYVVFTSDNMGCTASDTYIFEAEELACPPQINQNAGCFTISFPCDPGFDYDVIWDNNAIGNTNCTDSLDVCATISYLAYFLPDTVLCMSIPGFAPNEDEIGGYIYPPDDNPVSGTLYLLADDGEANWLVVDSLPINIPAGGDPITYLFDTQTVGMYSVFADINPDLSLKAAPTYAGTNALSWLNTELQPIPHVLGDLTDITLVGLNDMTGNGSSIFGTLNQEGLVNPFDQQNKNNTVSGINILLFHDTYGLVRFEKTDISGGFVFTDLGQGDYEVCFDLLNNQPSCAGVILNSDTPDAQVSLNLSTQNSDLTLGATSIWPNPTDGNLHITWQKTLAQASSLKVVHPNGQVLISSQIESGLTKANLDLANLDAGLYFITLDDKGIGRVVKTEK